MANGSEERLLSHDLNAIIDIDGVVGFVKSLKKSAGDAEEKKIGINQNGYVMNQSGEKKPIEYDCVLMVPKTDTATYMGKYVNDAILSSFRSGLDDPLELAKAGDMKILTADWDAAVLDNNVVEVSLKLKTIGFTKGAIATAYGAYIGVSSGGGGA